MKHNFSLIFCLIMIFLIVLSTILISIAVNLNDHNDNDNSIELIDTTYNVSDSNNFDYLYEYYNPEEIR